MNHGWTSGRDLDKFRRKERASRRDGGEAQPVSAMLGSYLKRSSLGETLLPASPEFAAAWNEAAGPLATRCLVRRWEKGVLWVEAPDPGWKFELRWKLGPIAQALRAKGFPIKELRLA